MSAFRRRAVLLRLPLRVAWFYFRARRLSYARDDKWSQDSVTRPESLGHLLRLRALQDETGGFTAFITWSYQPEHTDLGGQEATGIEYLRMLALSRMVLDNFDNLQASWVTQGGKVGQLSLATAPTTWAA